MVVSCTSFLATTLLKQTEKNASTELSSCPKGNGRLAADDRRLVDDAAWGPLTLNVTRSLRYGGNAGGSFVHGLKIL